MDVGPYRHQTSSAGPYRKSRQLKNILTNLDHIATRSHILTHWTPTPPSSGMELRDEKSCDSSSPYGKEYRQLIDCYPPVIQMSINSLGYRWMAILHATILKQGHAQRETHWPT